MVSSLSGVVARKRPKALETNMSLLQDAKPSWFLRCSARLLGECGEAWNPPCRKPRIWNKEGSIRPLHWKLLTFRLNLRWDKDLSPTSISNFRTQDSNQFKFSTSIQILNLACCVCNRLPSMAQMMRSSSSKAAKLSCRSLPFEPRWRWKSTCDDQPNEHNQPRCWNWKNCTAGRLGSANTQTEPRLQNVQLFEQRHDAAPRESCEYSCVHLPYSGKVPGKHQTPWNAQKIHKNPIYIYASGCYRVARTRLLGKPASNGTRFAMAIVQARNHEHACQRLRGLSDPGSP